MVGLLCFVLAVLTSPFKSTLRLEAENAALRHQLMVLRRRLQGRVRLTNHDRWFLIQLYRWLPSILQVLAIIKPETLVRWHRAGFRCYWRLRRRRRRPAPRLTVLREFESTAARMKFHFHHQPSTRPLFVTSSVSVGAKIAAVVHPTAAFAWAEVQHQKQRNKGREVAARCVRRPA
jgi:hypothetical protein